MLLFPLHTSGEDNSIHGFQKYLELHLSYEAFLLQCWMPHTYEIILSFSFPFQRVIMTVILCLALKLVSPCRLTSSQNYVLFADGSSWLLFRSS